MLKNNQSPDSNCSCILERGTSSPRVEIVLALDPLIVPALDPVIVPVLEPVIVPVREPVIVPTREPLVRDPGMVPADETVAIDKVNTVAIEIC